ncbi:hypothetical protein ACFV2D_05205 [Streptomyces capillispiralis]|uniref:hypothetical protein n=1 Tax=Streptomyces capillispiralis TaxID=68182 RepID=UPI0036C70B22
MSDTTRRPGDVPLPDSARTTPATDPHATDPYATDPHGTDRPGTDRLGTAPHDTGHHDTGHHGTDPHRTDARGTDRLGSAPHDTGVHRTTPHDSARPGPEHAGPHHAGEKGARARLLRHDDGDKLAARLQHAVAEFVDAPRDAVQEADQVLEQLTALLTDAVTERRRTLRGSWRTAETDEGRATTAADTEQLRLALRDYRELAERLLRV